MNVPFFAHNGASGSLEPLSEILDGIKGIKWAGQVKRLRNLPKGSPEFDKSKKRLPAFMLSAVTNGGRKASDVTAHTGLLQIDIDDVQGQTAGELRDRIGEDRHIMAAWLSPSGRGVKAIMLIPASVEAHKEAFATASHYMRERHAVEIDKQCSNVNRLCYVSHDPDLVSNDDAVPLKVSESVYETERGEKKKNSSTSLNTISYELHSTHYITAAFRDYPNIQPHYQRLVARRYGKPQRGNRNEAMVEIVSSCFCAVASEFVEAFPLEYYHQHADVFEDYHLEEYKRQVETLIAGCLESYPKRLTEGERQAYVALSTDREQSAFRIAHSLSKCESDDTVLPPLFHLSCNALGSRLGVMDTTAWRILKTFQEVGIIRKERKGTKRTKGFNGVATVFKWMLAPEPNKTRETRLE